MAIVVDAFESINGRNGVYGSELAMAYASGNVCVTGIVEDVLLPGFVDDGESGDVLGDRNAPCEGLENVGVARMVEEHEDVGLLVVGG